MHSNFVKPAEAAKILGVHPRTVYRYLQQGKLLPEIRETVLGVSRDDLSRFVAERGDRDTHLPYSTSRVFLAQMHARLVIAERRISTLEYILNIKHESLEASDTELVSLYSAAAEAAKHGWPAPMEEMWGGVFLRLQTDHFERLETALGEKHPWAPFYRLACQIARATKQPEQRELVAAGRNHLRDTVNMWCILRGETPSGTQVLMRDASA